MCPDWQWIEPDGFREIDRWIEGGSSVLLEGPSGAGKTRMARELVHRHAARNRRVRFIATPAPALGIRLRGLAPVLPELGTSAASALDYATMVRAALLSNAVALLVVDDVHALDDVSAALLHQMVHAGEIQVLLNARTPETIPSPIADLAASDVVVIQRARALSRSQAIEFVEMALGAHLSLQACDTIWEVTQGNPLYVKELVAGSLESGTLQLTSGPDPEWIFNGAPRVSGRLHDTIARRVHRLPATARRLLECLTIASPLELDALGAADLDTIDLLIDAGYVIAGRERRRHYIGLAHPIYREVLTVETSTLRMAANARRMLATLRQHGLRRRGDRQRYASLLLETEGEAAKVHDLLAGAEEALAQSDDGVAEYLASAAFREAPVHSALILGAVCSRSGRAAEAEAILDVAWQQSIADETFAEVAHLRVRNLQFALGDLGAARRLACEALTLVEDERHRLALELLIAIMDAQEGDFSAAIELFDSLDVRTDIPHDAWIESLHWCTLGRVLRGENERALRDLDQIPSDHQPILRSNPTMAFRLAMNQVVALTNLGRLEEAVRQCETEIVRAGSHDRTATPIWQNLSATAHWIRGSLQDAQDAFFHAQRVLERADPSGALPMNLAFASVVAAERGDAQHATQLLEHSLGAAPHGQFRYEIFQRWATAWQHALGGDTPQAIAILTDWGEQAAGKAHNVYASYLLHTAIRFGHPAAASQSLCEVATQMDGPLISAQASHGVALLTGDILGLGDVADQLTNCEALLWAADCHRQIAQLCADDPPKAGRHLLRAHILSDGVSPVAPLASDRPAGAPCLTARQLDVARLAGLPAAQIGDRLFISVRTVETHLRWIYRKLRLHDREELVALVAKPSVDPPGVDQSVGSLRSDGIDARRHQNVART